MALPTSYTQSGFADYLKNEVLGAVAFSLELPSGFYDSVIDETLIALGLTTISQVNSKNIRKVRMKGRIEAWRAVMSYTFGDIDVTSEGAGFSRSQVFESASEQLDFAENDYANQFPVVVPTTTVEVGLTQRSRVKVVW